MIVVTIKLVSAIDGTTKTLGRMNISNDGKVSDPNIGDYDVEIMRKPNFTSVTKRGRVEGHRRLKLTVWHLVAKALKGMGYA